MSGSLRDKLIAATNASEPKRQQPYDGVCGVLPFASWPANFQTEFAATRDNLLRDGYTAEQLQTYIADVIKTSTMALNNPDNPPNCNPACPFAIYGKVEILAHFWAAVRLGEDEGLAFLTDPDHAGRVTHGNKFTGRKPGAIGTVRKFIRAALKKNPATTNDQLWAAIVKRPPRDWSPIESPRLGRYVEGPTAAENVGWPRFRNIAAEERKRLDSPISEGVKAV